ncbi:MAG: AmmeMemoRadiSam system radical SAM enzyme [Syntrophales bacterium]|nr:AmmeMemoRadiSam system radical SAM enzyme [Syntrophales bacterium]MCK9528249.1 AmmeMemoRadiSam system radical SAM enzyme [Syntrophales bacterium]MDX9922380.1 AmmeMemoRadiSam system radical SAM enzyme [Syntrophales bacterium]
MKEALLYDRLQHNRVRCNLCAHRCTVGSGSRGVCGVRENRDGTLYSLVYGRVVAENVDPIEKKPFFHLCPGSRSYSIATTGCNFRCLFCQNHDISQDPRERQVISGHEISPEEVVRRAVRSGSRTIAYTYTEPTIFFEFALDVARLARRKGLMNVFVTNGYLSGEALETIAPVLDGANVDLKAFSDDFYRTQCGARLEPVLDTLRGLRKRNIWIEVTTLIIPSLNDTTDELRSMARFIRSLGPEIPWHISRYHPRYRMNDIEATPAKTILRAREIGMEEGLKYVYAGNLPGDSGEKTYCAACGYLLIDRFGYRVNVDNLDGAACTRCGAELDGIIECDRI